MDTTTTNLCGLEWFFLICASTGGILLAIRLVLQFVGADGHGDGPDFDAHHMDGDVSLKFLSLHGLTSFLLMFGLVGFALFRQNNVGSWLSIVGALAAGLASFWIIGKLFVYINKLQSSGTLSLEEAIGCEGEVYLTIPEHGTGRVIIHHNNRLREYDAISELEEALPTGERIIVLHVKGATLVVGRT